MPLSRIVIVGNDDIAWIAADMLARAVRPPFVAVHLVRPDEAVSPWAALAHGATLSPEATEISDMFGRDELALIRATRGNFLVGSVLRGFGPADAAFLPFGAIGEPAGQIAFHHLIARRREADRAPPLSAFMGGSLCAQAERFAPPAAADAAGQAAFNYGLHVDGGLYAAAASADAVARGVTVTNGSIALIDRDDAGHVTSVTTDDGTAIAGDLFVDCGNWLDDDPPVVDWSRWLPCNRLAGMVRDSADAPSVSMRLAAHLGGWRRQGSLVGAVVDSFAFCDVVPGEWPAASVAFRAGRCETPWRGNCVAIGDGAVILDPISDMRLHLALSAIARLAGLLPASDDQGVEAREYNRRTVAELDHARDFAIAHYCLNGRVGDPFWDQCRTMVPPDTLQQRIALYRGCGRIAAMDGDPQPASAWIALFDALGVRPARYDSLADLLSPAEVDRHLMQVRDGLVARVGAMPPYRETARLVAGR